VTIELGRFGIWLQAYRLTPELAAEVEKAGYGAIWIGSSPSGDLTLPEHLLDATSRIVVGTSIVNVWKDDAAVVAASYHRLEARHPGRFVLGVGVGHPEQTERYNSPYHALTSYLDVLDAEGVPAERRVLAALQPKVLRLAAERSAGALPYLVTPEHTRRAREILDPGVLLAPEHKVVLSNDPEQARAIGRPRVHKPYLGLVNYTRNLRTLGYTEEDLAGSGSDRLIDDLTLHGSAETVAAGLTAHLDAGADHVAVQLLTTDDAELAPGYETLAAALQTVD
jgi:probable F420-dependent oxidoreductase